MIITTATTLINSTQFHNRPTTKPSNKPAKEDQSNCERKYLHQSNPPGKPRERERSDFRKKEKCRLTYRTRSCSAMTLYFQRPRA